MKTTISGLMCLFLTGMMISLYSQETEVNISYNMIPESRPNSSFSDLPFQVGLEFGPAVPLKEKKYFYNGWWIYGHVNLYTRRIFLRATYGNLKLNSGLGGTAPYLQLGTTFIPLEVKQHSLSVNLGLCFLPINKRAGIVAFFAGLNYLYRFNRYVSLSAGIQMPVIRKSHSDEYYDNPLATVGVVFF